MIKKVEIKCRRDVTYSIEAKGRKGSILRLKNMLEDCRCYVCYNHSCSNVIEGKQKCNKECELYTTVPFCKKEMFTHGGKGNGIDIIGKDDIEFVPLNDCTYEDAKRILKDIKKKKDI